jgi:hypothetical protein
MLDSAIPLLDEDFFVKLSQKFLTRLGPLPRPPRTYEDLWSRPKDDYTATWVRKCYNSIVKTKFPGYRQRPRDPFLRAAIPMECSISFFMTLLENCVPYIAEQRRNLSGTFDLLELIENTSL